MISTLLLFPSLIAMCNGELISKPNLPLVYTLVTFFGSSNTSTYSSGAASTTLLLFLSLILANNLEIFPLMKLAPYKGLNKSAK